MGGVAVSGAVVLTFDFDAESPWLAPNTDDAARDLTQLSWGAFGGRRGIDRILGLLDEADIRATFFVPGWTVDTYSDRVRDIHARGHEVGHHGYHHVPPVKLSASEQREDFLRGIEAIETCIGEKPLGYRSPSWQLTPVTFALLREFDFEYDSSCMGDDRPYVERSGGVEILELPVHWTLDDFPHLGWMSHHSGPLRDPAEMITMWQREIDIARREERPIVLTCHPELVGRAGPMDTFAAFVHRLRDDPETRFARCIDVASSIKNPASDR
jgi:peptidoglycan/xylan/chitin deacetylase (PgdA/CDA1 family)